MDILTSQINLIVESESCCCSELLKSGIRDLHFRYDRVVCVLTEHSENWLKDLSLPDLKRLDVLACRDLLLQSDDESFICMKYSECFCQQLDKIYATLNHSVTYGIVIDSLVPVLTAANTSEVCNICAALKRIQLAGCTVLTSLCIDACPPRAVDAVRNISNYIFTLIELSTNNEYYISSKLKKSQKCLHNKKKFSITNDYRIVNLCIVEDGYDTNKAQKGQQTLNKPVTVDKHSVQIQLAQDHLQRNHLTLPYLKVLQMSQPPSIFDGTAKKEVGNADQLLKLNSKSDLKSQIFYTPDEHDDWDDEDPDQDLDI